MAHDHDALTRLPDERVAELLECLARLETEVANFRSRVSAPDRCENLLEALYHLREGVERFAFAMISSQLDALSLARGEDLASAREAVHRLQAALGSAIR